VLGLDVIIVGAVEPANGATDDAKFVVGTGYGIVRKRVEWLGSTGAKTHQQR
jgi:hypothetical protein